MQHRIIISGGGTGGHIYPALSIAGALRKIEPDIEILFVGAEGKMEMEKVPAAGYRIIGLPVAGLQRRLTAANLSVPFKVLKSIRRAGRIIKEFRPDVVVGVGGYASAPMLWRAEMKGIPTLIQEQNSFAGLTNKILGKRARRICVAYSGMERFFPADRIIMTGNPIRDNMHPCTDEERRAGQEVFSLDPSLPTVLIVGGSGGCGTFNSVMKAACRENGGRFPYQIIWQSGKGYAASVSRSVQSRGGHYIGTVRRRQGHDIRSVTKRHRGPSDPQRHGAGGPGRRIPGLRRQGCDRPASRHRGASGRQAKDSGA